MKFRHQGGFTLVEVLIVVVIMAVLAATVIPQFTSTTEDAKKSTLKFNLQTLRKQIQLYKLHHGGAVPVITGASLPQLTTATNALGATGAAGTSFPFGPYLVTGLLDNPFNGKNTVVAATTVPPTAPIGDFGWQYDGATGRIWANTTDFITN